METQLSKGKTLFFFIVVCLTHFSYMNDMIIAPVVATLYDTFPSQVNLANFIVSGPALIMTLTMFASAWLMQKVSKKTLIIVSMIFFTIGGIGGALFINAYYMAFMRGIIGASVGIISTVALAMLSEVYSNEEKRGVMMGIYNAVMSAIGAVLSFVAGQIVILFNWTSVWGIYWVSIPITILCFFGLPQTPAEGSRKKENEDTTKTKFPLGIVLGLSLAFLCFGTLYNIVYYQISVYVADTGIGNEALAGTLASIGTIGCFIFSLAFGPLYKKWKHGIMIVTPLVMGLSYAAMYLFPSIPIGIISTFLIGACFGLAFSCLLMEATVFVPQEHVSSSIAICSAIAGFSMFLSTYFTTLLRTIMQVNNLHGILLIVAVIAILIGIAEVFLTIYYKKKGIGYNSGS